MNTVSCDLSVRSFLLTKSGTGPMECEDAIAFNRSHLIFAIADGATEAYDSRSWARLLVRSWVRIDPAAFAMVDFEPLLRELGIRLHRKWARRKLPWYAAEKAQSGSFTAFLGLQLFPHDNDLHWRALAAGDCCLIHRRNGVVDQTFPISSADDFGWNPILLPSLTSKQKESLRVIRQVEGQTGSGDDFLLLTDAVAAWFLRQVERGSKESILAFDQAVQSNETEALGEFFGNLRNSREIRNDDIAVLRISIC
jgi:hypothetical protein